MQHLPQPVMRPKTGALAALCVTVSAVPGWQPLTVAHADKGIARSVGRQRKAPCSGVTARVPARRKTRLPVVRLAVTGNDGPILAIGSYGVVLAVAGWRWRINPWRSGICAL